ncbi:MAG: DUF1571 domain-containing protein [Deltaproteobacteria bacterium]|nr:DUF1571 domain-containing protein [Deltaproteobacteria bacterium]
MTRRHLAAILGILTVVLLPAASFAQAPDVLEKFLAVAEAHTDGSYNLTMRHFVRGKLQPEERVAVKSRKDGAVYAKWTGARNKGRELIYRPGWNGGKAWVKEGGALDFAAVAIALDDKAMTYDYRRSPDFFALSRMAEVLRQWMKAGAIQPAADEATVVIKSDETMRVSFGADGTPRSLEIENAKGGLLESYTYANVRMNGGFADADFDPGNATYGFPGYAASGIFIDAEKLKKNLTRFYGGVTDYTYVMKKQERIGEKLQDEQTMRVKFRKPGDIYMHWLPGAHEGRELIFRAGKDEKVTVHEGGLLGVVTVRIDPDGDLMKRDSNHALTESDFGSTIKKIYDNLSRGQAAGKSS